MERQRPQQHGVYHAEDGAVGSDPERQREHSHQSKTRILSQHPHAVPNVLPECLRDDLPTHASYIFFHTLSTPHAHSNLPHRFFPAHTCLHFFRRRCFHVTANLFVEFQFRIGFANQRFQPAKDSVYERHFSSTRPRECERLLQSDGPTRLFRSSVACGPARSGCNTSPGGCSLLRATLL